jgi:hypothetical protein
MSAARHRTGHGYSARAVVLGVCLALGLAAAAGAFQAADPEADRSWIGSPERRFGAPRILAAGRAVLYDEVDDAALATALSAEVRRLQESLFSAAGWRSPLPDDEPLRIYVARRDAGGVRRLSATRSSVPHESGAALLIDASRMTDEQIAREASLQIARATIGGYGVASDPFLETALAEWLSAPPEEGPGAEAWSAAAGAELDVESRPAVLGRLWIDEIARAAGDPAFLREVWERAAGGGDAPRPLLLRMLSERSRVAEDELLARFAARLYARLEPEASPSRLRLAELDGGALDAAAPESMRVRHRSLLPEAAEETLRVEWPEDAGRGAAVVRYRDEALPPDAVFFAPGDRRSIPLAGVARVDFVVAGSSLGGGALRSPARVERGASIPYAGLEAHASSGSEGPRVWWTTSSHDGLWGWAVFREEVLPDGRVARTGPEIVPSTERAETSYRYAYVDRASAPGAFYRYTVWAVTDEGLLARAFAVTLKTGD